MRSWVSHFERMDNLLAALENGLEAFKQASTDSREEMVRPQHVWSQETPRISYVMCIHSQHELLMDLM